MMVDLPVIVVIYHDGDFDGEFRVTLMVIWWWFSWVIYGDLSMNTGDFLGICGDLWWFNQL